VSPNRSPIEAASWAVAYAPSSSPAANPCGLRRLELFLDDREQQVTLLDAVATFEQPLRPGQPSAGAARFA
jgi:hypothetical protein